MPTVEKRIISRLSKFTKDLERGDISGYRVTRVRGANIMPCGTKRRERCDVGDLRDKLKAIRDKHGLTQESAAEKVGVQPSTWISWENERRQPGRLAMRLLEAHFPEDFPKKPKKKK